MSAPSNLITNGDFDSSIDNWITMDGTTIVWEGGYGHLTAEGCLTVRKLDWGSVYQIVSDLAPGRYRVEFSVMKSHADAGAFLFDVDPSGTSDPPHIYEILELQEEDEWYRFEFEFHVPRTQSVRVFFQTGEETHYYWVDDVALYLLDEEYDENEPLTNWRLKLMSERDDLAGLYHTQATYERVIFEAVNQAPHDLWPTAESTYWATGEEEYDLYLYLPYEELQEADILNVQVRPAPTGTAVYQDWMNVGYTVRKDALSLNLRFDRGWSANYEIRVYHRKPPTQPTSSVETRIDHRWLLADCMVRLLRRPCADLTPQERIAQLQYWTQERDTAHKLARTGRPPRKAFTAERRLGL